MTPLKYSSRTTSAEGMAVPFCDTMPPLTVQVLPALSMSLVADGIMLPLAEPPEATALATGAPKLLDRALLASVLHAGTSAPAGCVVFSHAPDAQLHQSQWMFSWKIVPL